MSSTDMGKVALHSTWSSVEININIRFCCLNKTVKRLSEKITQSKTKLLLNDLNLVISLNITNSKRTKLVFDTIAENHVIFYNKETIF